VCTSGGEVSGRCTHIGYVTSRAGQSQVQLHWTDSARAVLSQGLINTSSSSSTVVVVVVGLVVVVVVIVVVVVVVVVGQ